MNHAVKVTAYITREHGGRRQLLVFKEQGMESYGLQVPGGTVDPGEDLQAAILREIREESGLTDVRLLRDLGACDYFLASKQQQTKRHFYHLTLTDAPDTFTHTVQSQDEDNGWIYHYFWLDLTDELPTLGGYLGACLQQLHE